MRWLLACSRLLRFVRSDSCDHDRRKVKWSVAWACNSLLRRGLLKTSTSSCQGIRGSEGLNAKRGNSVGTGRRIFATCESCLEAGLRALGAWIFRIVLGSQAVQYLLHFLALWADPILFYSFGAPAPGRCFLQLHGAFRRPGLRLEVGNLSLSAQCMLSHCLAHENCTSQREGGVRRDERSPAFRSEVLLHVAVFVTVFVNTRHPSPRSR